MTAVCALWSRVPFVPTTGSIAQTMIHEAQLRPGDKVYDLGAGDGRLLILAQREEPTVIAVGFEIVPVVWLFAQVRILLSRSSARVYLKNAFRQDLRDADCILLYLIPAVLKTLAPKLDRELKPGARVISHAFSLPGRLPTREVIVPRRFGKSKVYVYEW